MGKTNYWWLFIKNLEIIVDQMEIGEEADVSRLAGADHKHVKEHYDAAQVGDKLLISVFGSVTEVHGLGEITYKDDEVLRFKKIGKLRRHISNGNINNDEMIMDKGFCDEKGTLKPLDEESYNHIIEDVIGLDNLTLQDDFDAKNFKSSEASPVVEKTAKTDEDSKDLFKGFKEASTESSPYKPLEAEEFSWFGQKQEEKKEAISDDENFELIKKLIIKMVVKANSKEELIEDLKDIL